MVGRKLGLPPSITVNAILIFKERVVPDDEESKQGKFINTFY